LLEEFGLEGIMWFMGVFFPSKQLLPASLQAYKEANEKEKL
jgi:hypothetical protein